jgi:hypothetical protein
MTTAPMAAPQSISRSGPEQSDTQSRAQRSVIQAERADEAVREILRTQYEGEPALVVPSPPGAGKTDVIEKLAAQSFGAMRERCVVVLQTNQQAFDFVARFRRHFGQLPVTLYCRDGLPLPEHIVPGPLLRATHEPAALPTGPCVVVANAAKLAMSAVPVGAFDLMVADEVWQLPNYQFLSIAGLAARVVLVGDPGQIAPVVAADAARWSANLAGPHVPAPQALLANHPDTRVIGLPVTRRLVDDSARIVQRAFYPDIEFGALHRAEDRRIEFRQLAASHPLDAVLRQVESGVTISLLELPAAAPVTADGGVAATIAVLLARIVARGAHLVTPDGARLVEASRVGVVCAHRAQVRAVRARLGLELARGVLVETANRYQGLERDVVIVWHPLTGRSSIRDFHVDAGRFCVMLSRHRAACLIVGRAGADALLARYTPDEPRRSGSTPTRSTTGGGHTRPCSTPSAPEGVWPTFVGDRRGGDRRGIVWAACCRSWFAALTRASNGTCSAAGEATRAASGRRRSIAT